MKETLETTAQAMVAPGKGILAADESTGTIEKRLTSINVASTEDNRRAYREMLFTARGLGDCISGVILYDETIRQKASDGTPFVETLSRQGVIPGIKVDKGTKKLAGAAGESVTEGLDGLRERFADYAKLGARFSKWRATIHIGANSPTRYALAANAHALARYAALSQEAGIVPMVEPEVLMDGAHTVEQCFEASERTLRVLFSELSMQRVRLEGTILKTNMVVAGEDCPQQASVEQVAELTVRLFRRTVPAAIPGIAFLSGGQSDEAATAHLNAMNAAHPGLPWRLSFSYGRALQAKPLAVWAGKNENVAAAQRALLHRAKMNGAASLGQWQRTMEAQAA